MPIDRIPTLSADYPLFDWDDHLQSYYALGEGELVSGFQKETWNAIIDQILAALSAAGMSWDSRYTTAAKAKITEAYGPLSAKMFNSVRYNIDRPAPVGWGWANNPKIRGFVGREDFKGYADYGLNGDLFYAEYLLEMVRRLNLMLSIMKGTANLSEMDAPILSLTESVHDLKALPSAPLIYKDLSESSFICGLQANQSGHMAYRDNSESLVLATVSNWRSRPMNSRQIARSLQHSKMEMPLVRQFTQYQHLARTLHQAAMDVFNVTYLSSGQGLARTTTKVTLATPPLSKMQSENLSKTIIYSIPTLLSPTPMETAVPATTKVEAGIEIPRVTHARGQELSRVTDKAPLGRLRPRRAGASHNSTSKTIAVLDSAWYAPIWVDGKLYIRQAYNTIQNGNTLEVT